MVSEWLKEIISRKPIRARKGMCQCGHLRYKDHITIQNDKGELISLGCKKCDCKEYRPMQIKPKEK